MQVGLTSTVIFIELEPNACQSFNDSYESNLFTVHQVRGKFPLSNVFTMHKIFCM
jgi:hypothetical protein